jgi:hypothetical protein
MSKNKLAGIVTACMMVIIVVTIVITHPPRNTEDPEQISVSAYNLSEQLFDPQLTTLQRDTLWKQYEGKQVNWTSELQEVVSAEEGVVARFLAPSEFGWSEIRAAFAESQSSNLSQYKRGDLVSYRGTLSNLGEAEISLTDCAVTSPAVATVWWNRDIDGRDKRILVEGGVLCLGSSEYADIAPSVIAIDTEKGGLLWELEDEDSSLVGVDSHYVYVQVPCTIPAAFPEWIKEAMKSCTTTEAIDKSSGQITSGVTNQTESSLIHLNDRLPLSELTYECGE